MSAFHVLARCLVKTLQGCRFTYFVGVNAVHLAKLVNCPLWPFYKSWSSLKLFYFSDGHMWRFLVGHCSGKKTTYVKPNYCNSCIMKRCSIQHKSDREKIWMRINTYTGHITIEQQKLQKMLFAKEQYDTASKNRTIWNLTFVYPVKFHNYPTMSSIAIAHLHKGNGSRPMIWWTWQHLGTLFLSKHKLSFVYSAGQNSHY